jgi:hypothetical protein
VAGNVSTLSTVSTSAMTHNAIPGFLYAYDSTDKVDISSWVERTPGAVNNCYRCTLLKWFRTTVQAQTHLSPMENGTKPTEVYVTSTNCIARGESVDVPIKIPPTLICLKYITAH